jgi:hypothetical protein
MDTIDHLRIIANPFRLAHAPKPPENVSVSHDAPLFKLLQEKYKGIYLNPCFLKTIVETIDRMVHENMVDAVVSDIVDSAIQRALRESDAMDEFDITLSLE